MDKSLWWVGALALLGCGGGDKADTTDDTTDDTTVTGDTDTGDTDVPAPTGPLVLTGTLRDDALQLVTSGVRVQYCRGDACRTAYDFTDGVYTFYDIDPGPGSFEIVNLDEENGRVSLFAPISVDETTRTLDVSIPNAGAKAALPGASTWLTVANGLELQLGPDQLEPPTPFDPDVTEVWGARTVEYALPLEGVDGTLLAMYYLEPFNAVANTPIALRIANSWAVGDGEASAWYADYATSAWTKLGDLVDDGTGSLTVTGAGLPKLTTFVVVRNP